MLGTAQISPISFLVPAAFEGGGPGGVREALARLSGVTAAQREWFSSIHS
jgi:hypothetical protein